MSTVYYDPTLETSCDDCEEICSTEGCKKLFMIGPCDAIIRPDNPVTGGSNQFPYVPATGLLFTGDSWCEVSSVNSFTYNPNLTIEKKGYLGGCYPRAKTLSSSPTIDVDIDYCRFDISHARLESGCKVAFMCMEDKSEFDENISADGLPCIMYGVATIEPSSYTSEFGTTETRSYTLHVSEYFWRLNHDVAGVPLTSTNFDSAAA